MRVAKPYQDILLNLGFILPTESGCIILLYTKGYLGKDKGEFVEVAKEQSSRLSIVERKVDFLI